MLDISSCMVEDGNKMSSCFSSVFLALPSSTVFMGKQADKQVVGKSRGANAKVVLGLK